MASTLSHICLFLKPLNSTTCHFTNRPKRGAQWMYWCWNWGCFFIINDITTPPLLTWFLPPWETLLPRLLFGFSFFQLLLRMLCQLLFWTPSSVLAIFSFLSRTPHAGNFKACVSHRCPLIYPVGLSIFPQFLSRRWPQSRSSAQALGVSSEWLLSSLTKCSRQKPRRICAWLPLAQLSLPTKQPSSWSPRLWSWPSQDFSDYLQLQLLSLVFRIKFTFKHRNLNPN